MAEDIVRQDPELTNLRAEREWKWLCQRVGEARARAAIARIPGNRRPFPLNIARVLGVDLPDEALLPALNSNTDAARAALAEIRKCLQT